MSFLDVLLCIFPILFFQHIYLIKKIEKLRKQYQKQKDIHLIDILISDYIGIDIGNIISDYHNTMILENLTFELIRLNNILDNYEKLIECYYIIRFGTGGLILAITAPLPLMLNEGFCFELNERFCFELFVYFGIIAFCYIGNLYTSLDRYTKYKMLSKHYADIIEHVRNNFPINDKMECDCLNILFVKERMLQYYSDSFT